MADQPIADRCARCKTERPLSEFGRCSQRPSGHKPYCRQCCREYEATRRLGPAGDRIREIDRKRRHANLEHRRAIERLAGQRRRARDGYLEKCRSAETKRLEDAYKASNPVKICRICRVEFCNLFGRQSAVRTCSDACSKEVGRRRKARKDAKRKAAIRAAVTELVDPRTVFERDGWRCHMCGRKTREEWRGKHKPLSPELDHIVPLSRGGEHTYRNTACACRRCNMRKGATPKGQLLLFG